MMSSQPTVFRAGKQRDVRHSLELHSAPRVGVRAAVRPRRFALRVVPPLEPRRLLARRLVIVHESVLDDEECLWFDTFIVVTDRRASAFLRAVALDVHELRAVAEFAKDFVGGRDETGAGVVRLVPERAIELSRMRD